MPLSATFSQLFPAVPVCWCARAPCRGYTLFKCTPLKAAGFIAISHTSVSCSFYDCMLKAMIMCKFKWREDVFPDLQSEHNVIFSQSHRAGTWVCVCHSFTQMHTVKMYDAGHAFYLGVKINVARAVSLYQYSKLTQYSKFRTIYENYSSM